MGIFGAREDMGLPGGLPGVLTRPMTPPPERRFETCTSDFSS
jgi:hypothetical protein